MPEKTLEKLTRDIVKTLLEGSTLSMLGIRDNFLLNLKALVHEDIVSVL